MPPRGPSQQWQSESDGPLLLAGFKVLYRSMARLWTQQPSLARFIVARAFYQVCMWPVPPWSASGLAC